jgi:diaminopimelate decarboxylase
VKTEAPPAALEAGDIFPDTTRVTDNGLSIGGRLLAELAAEYGTPLYVFDQASILSRAAGFRDALRDAYPGNSLVCYASKAYAAPWLLAMVRDAGLGLDVVSAGELYAGLAVDFPRERIYFHGNNKGRDELERALDDGVGRVVVDNLDEIELLGRLAATRGIRQSVLLRVGPGVDAHTHAHLTTGTIDTKFGLDIESGQAALGIEAILSEPALKLRGIHAHIGSQIAEIGPYRASIDRLFAFAAQMRDATGFVLREISPGGGFGVRHTPESRSVDARAMIRQVGEIVASAAAEHGFADPLPELTIEPGRSLIASSAVAVYRVGSVKTIPGVRTYVAVDGGMADNIRPTAYGAEYTAVLANRVSDRPDADVAIVGRYCETGDVLIQRVRLPLPRVGDLVAIPTAGAYHLSMASNYNMSPRPAVVAVAEGTARLVRRRETFADLLAPEIIDSGIGTRGGMPAD